MSLLIALILASAAAGDPALAERVLAETRAHDAACASERHGFRHLRSALEAPHGEHWYTWKDKVLFERDFVAAQALPPLVALALAAPGLRVPQLTPPGPGRDRDLAGYRGLLHDLAQLARHLKVRGRVEEGLQVHHLSLQLQTRLLRQGCWWIYPHVASSLKSVNQFQIEQRLSRAQARRLLDDLRRLPCEPADYNRAMEHRLAWVLNLLEKLERREPGWSYPGLEGSPAEIRGAYLQAYETARPAFAPLDTKLFPSTLARDALRVAMLRHALCRRMQVLCSGARTLEELPPLPFWTPPLQYHFSGGDDMYAEGPDDFFIHLGW